MNEEMNEELPLILVIDDEEKLRSGLELFLKKSGFRVKTATDGNRGLIMARQLNPDIILCDVMMPEMDGFELRKSISADPLINHIPFIFLTARTASKDIFF